MYGKNRNRNLTKSRAVQSITAQLNFNPSEEETEKFTALDQYLAMLDSYERLSVEVTQHGTCVAGLTTRGTDMVTQQSGQSAVMRSTEVQVVQGT